jgi:CubicO group peptidase (beta-lactamase class C family)
MKKLFYFILTIIIFAGCLKDGDLKTETTSFQPKALNDGWPIDTISDQNFNMQAFDKIVNDVYSEDKLLFIRSLLIIHNGKLITEMYPKSMADRDKPQQLWSVTKSFVSLTAGIAFDKGLLNNVKSNIFDYLPEYKKYASGEKLSITIEQCLTMRSGIDYDNDGPEEEDLLALVPDDLTRYIIQRPMKSTPGTETAYKNSDPQLLIKIIENASDTDFVEFANAFLFKPLGIDNYFWSRNRDKTPYGGFGLWLTPRDLAKAGQLILNRGMWKGKQVVSEKWIAEATTNKTVCNGYNYGYLIWNNSEKGYYWFWGRGGQYVFMNPSRNTIVVITSEPNADLDETTIDEATDLADRIHQNFKD